MSLKALETDLEISFVEHILDAMMKRATDQFLCLLEIQYMIDNVFFVL